MPFLSSRFFSSFFRALFRYLPKDLVDAELEGALTQWSVPTGIAFTHTPYAATADIIFSWSDLSATNNYLFDGPGGALAIVAGKVR